MLGDDYLLVDITSDENYDEISINHANHDKMNDDDKKEIECLTKELNTLKLAHETTLEDHRELLKTNEKLRFENFNLEQEHGFLKAINDDLHKESCFYVVKRLLLSTYMPQVKSSNKSKKILLLVVTMIMLNPILLLLAVLLIPLMILLAKLYTINKIAY